MIDVSIYMRSILGKLPASVKKYFQNHMVKLIQALAWSIDRTFYTPAESFMLMISTIEKAAGVVVVKQIIKSLANHLKYSQ